MPFAADNFAANEKHMASKWPAIPVLEEAAETMWRALNRYRRQNTFNFFRLSCNIQTLFYWGRTGELYTNYHIRLISLYKYLKKKLCRGSH